MFRYLPRRDDVAGLSAPCVNDEVKNAAGLSQRLNTFLAVGCAVVDQFNDFRIIENADRLREIDLAEVPVFLALHCIPAERRDTIRYLFCVHNFNCQDSAGFWH